MSSGKTKDFYKRVVVSCFDRRGADVLDYSFIWEDALIVLSTDEAREHLPDALAQLVEDGKLEPIKGKKEAYRIQRRLK